MADDLKDFKSMYNEEKMMQQNFSGEHIFFNDMYQLFLVFESVFNEKLNNSSNFDLGLASEIMQIMPRSAKDYKYFIHH